jgi:uncharacterized damage-inducible protein DinB
MRSPVRILTFAAAIAVSTPTPMPAQPASTVTADLLEDIGQVEKKMIALARAIPDDKAGWRPAPGTRSVSEVVMHVASDNYLIPAALGFAADAATGIKGDDYNTAVTFEKRSVTRAQAIAELEKSFTHLRKSLRETPDAKLGASVKMFGQPVTMQQGWIMATTHLHEHLGQLIAYARSVGVTPPWSS